jgi:hypothetical protein
LALVERIANYEERLAALSKGCGAFDIERGHTCVGPANHGGEVHIGQGYRANGELTLYPWVPGRRHLPAVTQIRAARVDAEGTNLVLWLHGHDHVAGVTAELRVPILGVCLPDVDDAMRQIRERQLAGGVFGRASEAAEGLPPEKTA